MSEAEASLTCFSDQISSCKRLTETDQGILPGARDQGRTHGVEVGLRALSNFVSSVEHSCQLHIQLRKAKSNIPSRYITGDGPAN